jgi:drug/metabolite transporter (DMT)-like permease
LSGANYVLGKVVLTDLSPSHLVALIFSIAAILQGLWITKTGQWRDFCGCSPRGWFHVFLFSSLSVAALWTLWAGIKYLDPTVASFISRLQTPVTVLLGIYLLQERFRLYEGIGGAFVLLGVVVIYASFDFRISVWFWVMVTSGILFGLTEVSAKVALRYLAPEPLSFLRTLMVAAFFMIVIIIKKTPLFNLGYHWWGVLAIGLMGPTLARLFYLFALKHLDVSKAALVNQIQPVFVAAIAFTFLHTIPTLRAWIGGVLILTGCFLMIAGKERIRKLLRNSLGG